MALKNDRGGLNRSQLTVVSLLIGALIMVAVLVWTNYLNEMKLIAHVEGYGERMLDGELPAWGFDLDPLGVERQQIKKSLNGKDIKPALSNIPILDAPREGYPNPDELVIGVEVNGEARAYPLSIIVWHGCINDTLGGEPILVFYQFETEMTGVYLRGIEGEAPEFGNSGLLYRRHTLIYDRQVDPNRESLWHPMSGKAISGRAFEENQQLSRVNYWVLRWRNWQARHPESTIMSSLIQMGLPYRNFELIMREQPREAPEDTELPGEAKKLEPFMPMVVVEAGEARRAYPMLEIVKAGAAGIEDRLGGQAFRLSAADSIHGVRIEVLDETELTWRYIQGLWFAVVSTWPEVEVHGIDTNSRDE